MRRPPRKPEAAAPRPEQPQQQPESMRVRFRRPPSIVDAVDAEPGSSARPVPPRRRPVPARPIDPMQQHRQRRPLPPGIEAPESGDDWRDLRRDVWQWIQTEWRKFRADPRGYIRDALQAPEEWTEEE